MSGQRIADVQLFEVNKITKKEVNSHIFDRFLHQNVVSSSGPQEILLAASITSHCPIICQKWQTSETTYIFRGCILNTVTLTNFSEPKADNETEKKEKRTKNSAPRSHAKLDQG